MNESHNLLTVEEFASAVRLKPSAVRRWARERRITIVHIGRLVRIPSEEVTRIIAIGTRAAKGVSRQ